MEKLIEKYNNLVWKYVYSFSRKFDGFKNSPLIDKEDLYQECVARMIELFVNSGETEDDFVFDHMELYHTMHLYVKMCLPVKTTRRTSDYKKHMNAYGVTENADTLKLADKRSKTEYEDCDFSMDCDRVGKALNGESAVVYNMLRNGNGLQDILGSMHVTRSRLRCMRRDIAVKWNKVMDEKHLYHGKRVGK